ncbi:hypothetical protein BU15DRAFT_66158 [Melanogaster broomeanus]|nr:hypothetical protein BU15DRAFT_66158 [Melanogaster broomeanus]
MSANLNLNNLTTWSTEMLNDHDDDSNELYGKKATERQRREKVRKPVEEVEKKRLKKRLLLWILQRAKCKHPRDIPKMHWRKWEEQMLLRGVKKKQVHTKSPKPEEEGEEVEYQHMSGTLMEVMGSLVEELHWISEEMERANCRDHVWTPVLKSGYTTTPATLVHPQSQT